LDGEKLTLIDAFEYYIIKIILYNSILTPF
jgi:hypothetical protein